MKVLFRNFSKIQLQNLQDSITTALEGNYDSYDVSFDVEGYSNTDLVARAGSPNVARFIGKNDL